MVRTTIAALALSMAAAACATTGGAGYPPGASRDVIVRSEIEATSVSNAHDLVKRLRPHMLRFRGPRSISGGGGIGSNDIVVYVDGVQHGGSASLRDLQTSAIDQIEYLDPSEATAEYGTGHLHGAILVTMLSGVRR